MRILPSVRSHLAVTLLAVVSLSTLGCGGEGVDSSETDAMLFGLTEAEIVSLLPLAPKPYDLPTWLDRNRAPFDCANYGTLCEHIGPDAAYALTEESYRLGLGGATREQINAFLVDVVDPAAEEWSAAVEGSRDDERASQEGFNQGGTSSERVKVKVWADVPGAGDPYVQVECTFQVKNFGVWGGNQTALMDATMSGHMHDGTGGIYDETGDYVTTPFTTHHFTTEKIFLDAIGSSDDVHGFGSCHASRSSSGFSATANANVVGS
jgi:hypothetical protein